MTTGGHPPPISAEVLLTFGGAALSAEMIMSKHCENCGCAIRSGYCTNCQEEAYIAFVQAPEMEFSEEFLREAFRQDSEANRREAS